VTVVEYAIVGVFLTGLALGVILGIACRRGDEQWNAARAQHDEGLAQASTRPLSSGVGEVVPLHPRSHRDGAA
jgi:hypothetical protein